MKLEGFLLVAGIFLFPTIIATVTLNAIGFPGCVSWIWIAYFAFLILLVYGANKV